MLPEFPRTLVFYLGHIVMGYPVRVVVKDGSTQVALLELVVCVEDRFDMIAVLYNVEPGKHVALEVIDRLVLRCMLDVEDRGKIALLKADLLEEVISLLASRRLVAPEVIGTTDEAIFERVVKVVSEIGIHTTRALSRFYDNEAKRTATNHGVLQLVPIYLPLIMRNVDAMYLVTIGILRVAIEGSPAKPGGADKEIIERPAVEDGHAETTKPESPPRQTATAEEGAMPTR